MEQQRILVVDDDGNLAEQLRILMENNGFLADKETDPRRVRTRVRQRGYDVILLDAVMPEYTGVDVIVDVKTFSPASKVIFMSGIVTKKELVSSIRLGADDCFEKELMSSQGYLDMVRGVLKRPSIHEPSALQEELIGYLWSRLKRVEGQQAGRDLEALAKLVFESVDGFEGVTSNVMTGIPEEIDIVVQNKSDDPFWRSQGELIFVECKAWSRDRARAGKNEHSLFYGKLEKTRRRSKLGFLICTSGFCASFQAEALTKAQEEILIVPIGPDDLEKLVKVRDRGPILQVYTIEAAYSKK
jgi:CheY-like chemotaxis protein